MNKWIEFWIEKDKEEIIKAYYDSVKYGEKLYKRIEETIKYCEESNLTLKSQYFMDVIKLLRGEIDE